LDQRTGRRSIKDGRHHYDEITHSRVEPLRRSAALRSKEHFPAVAFQGCGGQIEHRSVTFNHSSDFLQKGGGLEFVMTRHTNREAPANATLKQRLVVAYVNLLDRMRKKNPATALYVPSPIHACSVHAMLDECAELSGKRYLIAREALVVVYFGHTKTLNGAQWVAAFERALRDNGMLVLSNRGRAIKVVPKTKLDEYRKAGLVSDEDHPM
jgi:hypothetical protein